MTQEQLHARARRLAEHHRSRGVTVLEFNETRWGINGGHPISTEQFLSQAKAVGWQDDEPADEVAGWKWSTVEDLGINGDKAISIKLISGKWHWEAWSQLDYRQGIGQSQADARAQAIAAAKELEGKD